MAQAKKQENLGGGMTKEKLEHFARQISNIKSESAELRGDMSVIMKS